MNQNNPSTVITASSLFLKKQFNHVKGLLSSVPFLTPSVYKDDQQQAA
jgi:hypothetical protein